MSRGKEQRQSHFRGDQWFQRKVDERTRAALDERNAEFTRSHVSASREALLDYVRGEAARLGASPDMGEIIGGRYIAYRLRTSWPQVLQAAGLRLGRCQPELTPGRVYQRENQRQAERFRRERAEEKARKRSKKKTPADAADAACT